jgi:outer membrane protein TolC
LRRRVSNARTLAGVLFKMRFSNRLCRCASLLVAAVTLALPLEAQVLPTVRVTDTLRLSLGEAVTLAMHQSDELGIAAAQVNVADAAYGAARASVLPQLRLNSSYTHVYESARGQAVGSVFNQPNTYVASLNLSQTVFQGGRLVNSMRQADDVRDAARYDESELRAQMTVSVQRAYLQALFTSRIAELQEHNLAVASGRLTQVEQFEKAGRAARYDVLRARVERSNLEPLVIQARSDRELALLDLKRVLNVPLERPVSLATQIDSATAAGVVAALSDTLTLNERAAIRSAELNVSAKKLGVSVARADFYPALSVFFNSGYQAFPAIGQGFPSGNGALTVDACPPGSVAGRTCQNGGWFSDRQAGVNVSVPLFDGMRIKSNVDLAQAQARLAELQLRQTREAVNVDVAKARAELRRANAVFAARRQNSQEAEEAFHLAELRFSRGLTTQLEVSDAQLALLTAQSTEARATYDLFLAAADLSRALGRPIPIPSAGASATAPR